MTLRHDDTSPETTATAEAGKGTASVEVSRSKESLRLWLRLLPVTNVIENQLRARLREHFDITLAQFDVLSELEHAGEPQTMSELSRRLLVSGGHVTGVVDRLERDGHVARQPLESDRRVQLVALTERGKRTFLTVAERHEAWLEELLADMPLEEIRTLNQLLARTKAAVRGVVERRADQP